MYPSESQFKFFSAGGHFPLLFSERLVRNARFGSFCVFANVSHETLVWGGMLLRFCDCLVRNARFQMFASALLRMSRTKKRSFLNVCFCVFANVSRSFWEICFCFFANVSRETLVLGGLLLRFCKCLARNARFGRFASSFLRISRTKCSFWEVSL